ncbi:conserved hypothetical protein [Hahella chejuensis KCTC 2396]|uniref:Fe2OG dioxygenase domain-containing protein n=1 Tax=Hahella chejuensis (strain KCTC 2396) TaxID=349521 RepID=Q2S9H1_HAHCH|nr:2OG-Fe(II) oxygenase [Hahella chejuensis]ABC32703.1 conserved hypothetical protein [Hahella chejuensis KCTC 2396]
MDTLDLIQLARTYISYDKFDKAASALSQRLYINPNCPQAHDLLKTISDRREPNYGVIPSPRIVISDFLPRVRVDELLTLAEQRISRFEPGKVSGAREIAPERRNSLRLRDPLIEKKLNDWFSPHFRKRLTDYCSQLDVALFEISEIELKFCCYPNGAYFHIHRDDQAPNSEATGMRTPGVRRISFAYYFHRRPKSFTGGELQLYATDRKHDIYSRHRIESIPPHFNTLVLFPSGFYHEVLKITETSGEIMNGRFAINGHICEAFRSQESTKKAVKGANS